MENPEQPKKEEKKRKPKRKVRKPKPPPRNVVSPVQPTDPVLEPVDTQPEEIITNAKNEGKTSIELEPQSKIDDQPPVKEISQPDEILPEPENLEISKKPKPKKKKKKVKRNVVSPEPVEEPVIEDDPNHIKAKPENILLFCHFLFYVTISGSVTLIDYIGSLREERKNNSVSL